MCNFSVTVFVPFFLSTGYFSGLDIIYFVFGNCRPRKESDSNTYVILISLCYIATHWHRQTVRCYEISLANKCFFLFLFFTRNFTSFHSAHSLGSSPARSNNLLHSFTRSFHLHNVFQAISQTIIFALCRELVCIWPLFLPLIYAFYAPHSLVIASKFSAGYSCAIKTFQNKCAIMARFFVCVCA